jgi:hypothetical protein
MSVIVTTSINGRTDDVNELSFPAPRGKLNRLPAASGAPEQRILAVEFRSPDRCSWHAIGGGATALAAIDWRGEAAPRPAPPPRVSDFGPAMTRTEARQ